MCHSFHPTSSVQQFASHRHRNPRQILPPPCLEAFRPYPNVSATTGIFCWRATSVYMFSLSPSLPFPTQTMTRDAPPTSQLIPSVPRRRLREPMLYRHPRGNLTSPSSTQDLYLPPTLVRHCPSGSRRVLTLGDGSCRWAINPVRDVDGCSLVARCAGSLDSSFSRGI